MKRGYCGIGVVNMKTEVNYGTLFRSALAFDADFLFLIGRRFSKQSSDTTRSERHIPLYEHDTVEDFLSHRPYNCELVAVEFMDNAKDLRDFTHPERAIYVLGPEDGNIPSAILEATQRILKIPTAQCLNVSVAGSIILYDRLAKNGAETPQD